MSARKKVAVALLLMMPALTSCRLFRKPKPVLLPAKIPVQTRPVPAPPPEVEPPPEIPVDTEVQSPADLLREPPMVIPTPPSEEKRAPRPAPRVPAAAETPPPPAPAPQLVPMLTPAQRQELERSVNDRIGRAQNILASIAGRRLRREQQDMAGQIRTFLKQAEEARGTDLLRANNLAERAEVLAQNLARRLR